MRHCMWANFGPARTEFQETELFHKRSEIARRRLLCKNVNGVVFTTPLFQKMYPDATFIALVRNGLALCEGFVRRGWNARDFGILYDRVCRRMLEDARSVSNYNIVRFEDLLKIQRE